jgi:hypothetical protein
VQPDIWVQRAEARILEVMGERVVVVWPEIEAVIAEQLGVTASPINPHHLSSAQKRLLGSGQLVVADAATRGGRKVTTYRLADPGVSKREWEAISGRKRLLYGRYLGWATGTGTKQGVIGPALERALHQSIREAAPDVGYRLANPVGGETDRIGEVELPRHYGPLDNAVLYPRIDMAREYVIPIEAKNVRDWLYPWSAEPYQLLAKAAYLTAQFPDASVVPVLVCRRPHKTLLVMARELGFHVIDVLRQVIHLGGLGDPDAERKLEEVRAELGFMDMIPFRGPEERIVRQFRYTIPKVIVARSVQWFQVGWHFETIYRDLQDGSLPYGHRNSLLDQLRQETEELGSTGGW